MIQETKQALYGGFDRLRNNRVSILCVLLAISVLAAPAAAQVQDTFSDDFEDGNTDGWEGNGTYPTAVTESTEGTYSAYAKTYPQDSPEKGSVRWSSGPTLDLNSEFTVTATFKGNNIDTTDNEIRIGLTGNDVDAEGENAFVLFDRQEGITYLGTYATEPTPTNSSEYIADSFNDQWVNVEIYSPGDGTLEVKVWQVGTSKPSNPQLNDSFNASSGDFGFNVGTEDSEGTDTREAWLDSVTIDGTTVTDPTLFLDTGNYLEFGGTQDYTVYDLVGENQIRNDVTENATVTSGNTSVITVNQNTNELTATSDENVSTRVNITAMYEGRTEIRQVTVASPTIDNLEVLPFMWRISAMFLDRGFQMILVGLLLAIAATRVGGVFAGLGIYQMGLTAGWLIGWVPIGLAMVGLFATLFIGLNIAANIDYTVRR